jgi:phenylalanyl-tRNA synthetase beta chain
VARHNAARQVAEAAIFEVGHVFLPPTAEEPGADGGPEGVVLPAEPVLLSFAAYGPFDRGRHDRPTRDADVFDLLGAADLVRRAVGLPALATRAVEAAPYHPGRAARLSLGGLDVGTVGELHPRVAQAFELPPRTLAGELRLDLLVANGAVTPTATIPSPLPGVRFDVAVIVEEDTPARAVEEAVRDGAGERLTELALFDVFRGPQLGEGRKSLAYRLRLDDPATQLTDADARTAIEAVEAMVTRRLGGTLRR